MGDTENINHSAQDSDRSEDVDSFSVKAFIICYLLYKQLK